MTFRWIEGEDLEQLRPIMLQHGWTPLDPVFSKALIAEEDGKMVGFNVLQVVLRPEPMWVSPEFRGKDRDIAMKLATQMSDHLRKAGVRYWEVRAESAFAERLCVANGMELVKVPVFAGGV